MSAEKSKKKLLQSIKQELQKDLGTDSWVMFNLTPLGENDPNTIWWTQDILPETSTLAATVDYPREQATAYLNESSTILVNKLMKGVWNFMSQYVDDIEKKYLKLQSEIDNIKSSTEKTDSINFDLQERVIDSNKEYLLHNYKGKFVALSYEGKILDSSENELELIKKIKQLPIPKNQLFIYPVPLK